MAYNSGVVKWKSDQLQGLDCGHNIKAAPVDDNYPEASFTAAAANVIGIAECVAMIRVAANTKILGAELYWDGATTASVVAIGDPFACGRILGPIRTSVARGVFNLGSCHGYYGLCGTLSKMGTVGDGCGFGYLYECETDIVLTNLYTDTNATAGGWAGSSLAPGTIPGAAISAGTFKLILHVKKVTE